MYQIENPNGQNCLRQKQKLECEGMSHFFCVITCPTKNILKCTTSCMVHLETQLVELRSCNWVVAIFPFPKRSSAQSGLISRWGPYSISTISLLNSHSSREPHYILICNLLRNSDDHGLRTSNSCRNDVLSWLRDSNRLGCLVRVWDGNGKSKQSSTID